MHIRGALSSDNEHKNTIEKSNFYQMSFLVFFQIIAQLYWTMVLLIHSSIQEMYKNKFTFTYNHRLVLLLFKIQEFSILDWVLYGFRKKLKWYNLLQSLVLKYLALISLQVHRQDQIRIYKRLDFAVLSISLFTFSPISKQTAEWWKIFNVYLAIHDKRFGRQRNSVVSTGTRKKVSLMFFQAGMLVRKRKDLVKNWLKLGYKDL